MQIDAILTFRNYTPKKITKGMLFLVTSDDYTPIVYCLDKSPKNQEEIIEVLGYPVLPYIINPFHKGKGTHTLVTPDKIQWINEDGDTKEIEVDHFNRILTEFEGKIKLEVLEDKTIIPFLLEGGAVIYYPQETLVEI